MNRASKNIAWQEVFNEEYYEKWKNTPWRFQQKLDERIIFAQQRLIERFGTMYLNDWKWGGDNDSRGWRPPEDPDGAEYSDHKYGRALDSVPQEVELKEIHLDIADNPEWYLDIGITTIESIEYATSWLHISNRWHSYDGILVVTPDSSLSLEQYKELL